LVKGSSFFHFHTTSNEIWRLEWAGIDTISPPQQPFHITTVIAVLWRLHFSHLQSQNGCFTASSVHITQTHFVIFQSVV